MHHVAIWALRHDLRSLAVFSCANAALANCMPSSQRFCRHPRIKLAYEFVVDVIAFFALNWRKRLPSLEAICADPVDEVSHGHSANC